MVTYFCSNCWNEIKQGEIVCLHCGTEQEKLQNEPFVQKLIRALKHTEPKTPIRAAYILGKMKAPEALPFLWEIVERHDDPFIVAAALEALGEFTEVPLEQIESVVVHCSSVPVRSTLQRVIRKRKESKLGNTNNDEYNNGREFERMA